MFIESTTDIYTTFDSACVAWLTSEIRTSSDELELVNIKIYVGRSNGFHLYLDVHLWNASYLCDLFFKSEAVESDSSSSLE